MSKLKRRDRRMGISFPRRLILGWILSLFIPTLVFFLIMFVQYGRGITKVVTGDMDLFQRRGYSANEQIIRDINIWTLDNPVFQDHDELNRKIMQSIENKTPFNLFVVERKGDQVKPFYPISDERADEIEAAFQNAQDLSLPEYGERELVANQKLFDQTGFIMSKQIDLIYGDGEPGSIFIFIQITEIPSVVFSFLFDNLLLLIGILIITHLVISLYFTKKMTEPIDRLLKAMKRYQKQDFKPRLDDNISEPMLRSISTAVNEMAEALEQSQDKAERVENQRVEFIAKISHDTKTPLASIKAHAEAFRDGMITDNEKRMKYTNNILNKVDIINNMINELSLYSELETGVDQYHFNNLDMNYYLMDVLEELQYDYPEQSLKIDYIPYKGEKLIAKLDVTRFNRVLMNVIKNSVKYSDREMTKVKVALTFNEKAIMLSIRDNGKGMDSSETAFIFESFTRGDASRDPNKGGSGLGLAIAKTIVEGHGGTISAKTQKDKYFEIVIKLPREGCEIA